jgi:hypothetical protein
MCVSFVSLEDIDVDGEFPSLSIDISIDLAKQACLNSPECTPTLGYPS